MATVIFDLDYTLLDSDKLRGKLAEILGLSYDEYEKSYQKNFTDKNITYSFDEHLEILSENLEFRNKTKAIKEKFNRELENIDDLMYDGAIEYVENEKNNGNEVVLLTFANRKWQKEKIKRLNKINKVFGEENIKVDDKDKSESKELKELATRDEILIINDKIGEAIKMVDAIYAERKKNGLKEIKIEVAIIEGKYSENEIEIEEAKARGFKFYDCIKNVPEFMKAERNKEIENSFLKGESLGISKK
ncbi:MAG: haloacid dehalogenase-like hydrolase [Patescibacteria group bacterium]|jgi:phosphoglycolate phosphatase-like HAD superfamily hydrolase|nr:haloacid dehalogenase-like hydrolase [Patescibacteria group bacterium]